MDHSLRLSIKWLKKWESQKEISYRFLFVVCCEYIRLWKSKLYGLR